MRVVCVVYVTEKLTLRPIDEPKLLIVIKEHLCNVLKGNDDKRGVKTNFLMGLTHTKHWLHHNMFADRDYKGPDTNWLGEKGRPLITIKNCNEKGYSVVIVRCKDRPKLIFDIDYTLTNMQYLVLHATINSSETYALQVYMVIYGLSLCKFSFAL